MSWGIQVKIKDKWEWIGPTNEKRYEYACKDTAERMLNICYPDKIREQKLGSPITVRVNGITDKAISD